MKKLREFSTKLVASVMAFCLTIGVLPITASAAESKDVKNLDLSSGSIDITDFSKDYVITQSGGTTTNTITISKDADAGDGETLKVTLKNIKLQQTEDKKRGALSVRDGKGGADKKATVLLVFEGIDTFTADNQAGLSVEASNVNVYLSTKTSDAKATFNSLQSGKQAFGISGSDASIQFTHASGKVTVDSKEASSLSDGVSAGLKGKSLEFTISADKSSSHGYDFGKVTTAATCTNKGVKTRTCTGCSDTKTEDVAVNEKAHPFAKDWSKDDKNHWHAATCTHDVKSDQAEHNFDDGVVQKEATHTEKGELLRTCKTCAQTKVEEIAAKENEHTFAKEWSKDDKTHWHAATCAHTDVKGDLAEHDFDKGIIQKPATHTTDGETLLTCQTCKQTKTQVIPADANAHTFAKEWMKDDTTHWHAATCEHKDVKGHDAKHIYDKGTVTKKVTHTEDGELLYTCTVCSYTKTKVLPAKTDAHTFEKAWTYDQEDHWHASTCGHDYGGNMGPHTFDKGKVTKKATHKEAGEKTYTCTVCKMTKTKAIAANADAHTFEKEWSYDQEDHWHASTCGHDVGANMGAHKAGKWIVDKEATSEKEGSRHRECKTCGYVMKTESIAKSKAKTTDKTLKLIKGAKGNWYQKSEDGLSFTIDTDRKNFKEVLVDGKKLEDSNYTVASGSTIVTLKKSYLDTLKVGEHKAVFRFSNGEAKTDFTVKTAKAHPATGDNGNFVWYFVIFGVSLAGIAVVLAKRRPKK